jgi:hypothetical protein
MLRNLEQVHNADKSAAPGKLGGDIREADLEDLRHDDLARRKGIAASDLHVRSLPQADGARDLTVPNAIAEYPEELHSGCWVTSGNAPRLAPTDKHCRRDRETAPPPTLLRIEHQLLSADRAGHCADTSRTKGVERPFKKPSCALSSARCPGTVRPCRR